LMVVWDYKSQRDKFLRGLWESQEICQRTWDSRSTKRCKQTQDMMDMMVIYLYRVLFLFLIHLYSQILTGNTPRDMVCTKLILWELRIKEATVFTLETAFFTNYFLLMITVFLIPIVAISNGFEISFEEKLLNYTYFETYSEASEAMSLTIENLTLDTYILSHALGG